MFSRRKFLMAAGALSLMPLAAPADDRGFLDLISSIKDRSEREYFERHRDDARWDGRYYYDRKTNRRYSRDDWRKELRRRHQEERRRGARPGRPEPRRGRDDRRDPPRHKPEHRRGPDRRDDRRDHRPGR